MKTKGRRRKLIDCYKVAYSKLSHANNQVKFMQRKHGDMTLHAYRWPRWKRFHIGHDKYAH